MDDKSYMGHLVEGVVAQITQSVFFLKPTQDEEIDIMVQTGNITDRMVQKYRRLRIKKNLTNGYMITQNERKTIENEMITLQLIPLSELLLRESSLFSNGMLANL